MKHALTLLLALAAAAHAQFAVMHTNGVVTSPTNLTIQQSNVAGLSNALAGKLATNPTLAISNTTGLQAALDGKLATNGTLQVSNVSGLQSALDGKIGFNATNGQVQWTNTNALTFTNPISVRGTATNINAELLWNTHDNIGNGGIIVQSRSQLTNIWDSPTNAHTNWSIMWIGQNIQSEQNIGVVRARTNTGAAYLSIENAYNYSGVPTDPSSEIYFTVIGLNGGTAFRPLTIRTAFTNTQVGEISLNHTTSVEPKQSTGNVFSVNFSNAVAGSKNHLFLYNASTNNGRDVRLQMTVGTNDLIWSMEDSKAFAIMNLRGQVSYPFLFYTNGVVIGATGSPSPSARVHLAGNTYIDGNLSFANTTNQATTRTNLGLGGGITTNVSSGTLQFSNGILIGHTP